MSKCRIAAGEEWGNRWDFNKLVENHDIDYVRATLPNVGGITEMMKIAAHLRNAFRGHRSALHRTDLDGGAGELPGHVFRSGSDGVQLPGKHAAASAGVRSISRTANSIRTTGRAWALRLDMKQLTQIAEITEPVTNSRADLFPSRRIDHQLVNFVGQDAILRAG